jgi:putative DNA primase/helicase
MPITIPSSIAEIIPITKPLGRNGNGADAADNADDTRPALIIDTGDLPRVARQLRDIIAKSCQFFDRGGPARISWQASEKVPIVVRLNIHGVVRAAHQVCRPINMEAKPVTLPERVASLYLDMSGEWHLLPLVSISTAPILAKDGTIQTVTGYQTATGVFCCNIPDLNIPARPTRAEAETALATLRNAFRTFPFSDAKRKSENGVDVVDLDLSLGYDESSLLCGLLTAICRQSLWLAPGLLLNAPSISGAGTGKGLLVRAIASIAYGMLPRPFPPGNDRHEMDKRLVAEVIQGNSIVFMDNINGTTLKSDTLASFLTERPSQVRILGRSQMVQLELASFFALTGNGLVLSEDLARRFICVELDARCEDPEQRQFPPGFLEDISARRPELLAAGLIILRWGRQNADAIEHGKALGSFENWAVWVRDPLVALGCRDPVDRISEIKARDPERQRVIALFGAWHDAHGDNPVKVTELAEAVRLIADPNNRGRQYLARTIGALAGTRLGGFVLERLEAINNRKEGARYQLLLSGFGSNASASSAASASASAPLGLECASTSEDITGQNPGSADDADDADAFQAFPKAICAQCGGGPSTKPPADSPLEMTINGKAVWLHPECRRFYEGRR